MLTDAVLCLQSQFEDSTLCTAEDSKILLLCAFRLKIKRSHFNSIGKGKAFHGLLLHIIMVLFVTDDGKGNYHLVIL